MSVVSAISDSIDALKRNPVLFVAAFVVALVNLALLGVELIVIPGTASVYWSVGSLVAQLISLFFIGGAYAMATEGLYGETRLGTLIPAGRDNYLSLVGATILLYAAVLAVSIAVGIAVFVLVFVASGALGADAFGMLLFVLFGSYLLAFVPYFLLQFYGPAVVVSDEGAVGSLKRSFGLVRRNVLGTLGFDAVLVAVILVGAAPTVWLYATWWSSASETAGSPATEAFSPFAGLDPATIAAYFLSTLVLGTLSGAFFFTYQVSFYEQLDERFPA